MVAVVMVVCNGLEELDDKEDELFVAEMLCDAQLTSFWRLPLTLAHDPCQIISCFSKFDLIPFSVVVHAIHFQLFQCVFIWTSRC